MSYSSEVSTKKTPPAKILKRGRVINTDYDVDIGNLCVLDMSVNWTQAIASTASASSFPSANVSDAPPGDALMDDDDGSDAARTAVVHAAAQRAAELLFSRLAALPSDADADAATDADGAGLRVKLPAGRELLPAVNKRKPPKPTK
jgi:hypothetical protein